MIIFRATKHRCFLFFGAFLMSVRVWNWMRANAIWNMFHFNVLFFHRRFCFKNKLENIKFTLRNGFEFSARKNCLVIVLCWLFITCLLAVCMFLLLLEKFVFYQQQNQPFASKRQWAATCNRLPSMLSRIKQLEESKAFENRLREDCEWRKYSIPNSRISLCMCASHCYASEMHLDSSVETIQDRTFGTCFACNIVELCEHVKCNFKFCKFSHTNKIFAFSCLPLDLFSWMSSEHRLINSMESLVVHMNVINANVWPNYIDDVHERSIDDIHCSDSIVRINSSFDENLRVTLTQCCTYVHDNDDDVVFVSTRWSYPLNTKENTNRSSVLVCFKESEAVLNGDGCIITVQFHWYKIILTQRERKKNKLLYNNNNDDDNELRAWVCCTQRFP